MATLRFVLGLLMAGLLSASCTPGGQPVDPAASSTAPVDLPGLTFATRAVPRQVPARRPVVFEVTVSNTISKPVTIQFPPIPVDIRMVNQSTGAVWVARRIVPTIDAPYEKTVAPGRSVVVTVSMADYQYSEVPASDHQPGLKPWLAPGDYVGRLTLRFGNIEQVARRGETLLAGEATIEGIAFTVEGTAPGQVQPVGWTDLFAKEKWYRDREGKEIVFTGKLERVPGAGGPSTLMRTSWYKLGDRTIYTGGKKMPALEKLVGQRVQVLGKAVDMQLEGQFLQEIWPAAVKPAAEQNDSK